MNKLFKLSAVAAAALTVSGVAFADASETKGGIKIKTDDGRFEASVGGRIHFDGNLISEDNGAFNNTATGSNNPANMSNSGFYFRRIYLTLAGKLYGWTYKIENDFAGNNATGGVGGTYNNSFQDVYLATEIGPGELQIGQRKPFRAMEDLTSSNDVLMIERPFASSSAGLFAAGTGNREFQDGLFYHGNGDNYTWGVSFTSLRAINTPGTEGVSTSTRGTFTPLNEEGALIHLGANFSYERPANNQGAAVATTPGTLGAQATYGGRRGATASLGLTDNNVGTWGVEYANVFGPWFAQAEYYNQLQLASDKNIAGGSVASAPTNQTIEAYYVQTSFFVTGETKPYKKKDGVFGNPKPLNNWGAMELTARYDSAKNKDNPNACAAAGIAAAGAATDAANAAVIAGGRNNCRVSNITLGANYYVNPNVRFMLNYIIGKYDLGTTNGSDSPNALAARAQISF